MIGACSIPTGQISTHALHCMHDHTVSPRTPSSPITLVGEAVAIGASVQQPTEHAADPAPAAARLACSRSSRITSRGDSGRPVALAGQASWQRPHFVQASSCSRCNGLKSASVP